MDKKDIEIKYTRGSGPGGQHKNKVETCVVATHLPTGLQERCQDTRSRSRNEKMALKRLESKIQEQSDKLIFDAKKEKRKELIHNSKVIRTYNYNRNEVKDHRSKSKADLKKMMDGGVDLPL